MKTKLLLVIIVIFLWYVIDLDYDSQDSQSLERMMKWSPFSAIMLMENFQIASDDPYASNLDGLNVDEIHEIAEERRSNLNARQRDLIQRRNNGEYSILSH